MARFPLQTSLLRKTVVLLVCAAGIICARPAWGQHGGGHVAMGGGRGFVPPVSRMPGPRPVFAPTPYAPISQFGRGGIYFQPFPLRPFPFFPGPVFPFRFAGPFWFMGGWGYNPCWWLNCYLYWNWGYGYNPNPWNENALRNYVQPQIYQYPLYAYASGNRDYPQLYLKDGTVIAVNDYWVVDDQLHFVAIEGAKAAEHTIPLDDLDVQTTIDVNTRWGFRFVRRNEPIDQYLRDHPHENPPDWPAPPQ